MRLNVIVTLVLSLLLGQHVCAQNVFPATGNVGIGTASPTTTLNVANGAIRLTNPSLYPWGINMDVNFTSTWIREFSISRNTTGKLLGLGVYSKPDGTFNYAYLGGNTTTDYITAPWLAFTPNGMIGVNVPVISNTIAPAAWMDIRAADNTSSILLRTLVNGNDKSLMYLASYPVTSGYTGWKQDNVFESYTNLHISAANAGSSIFFETGRLSTTTMPRMQIDGNGNVVIGTSNSKGYKLAVDGTIGARKVKVTSESWADFVFEKNYTLPSLQEVEKYIASHGHLEGVPSTAEVNNDGVDVAEMNKILLQKVEELTLYMIELKKENAAQQTRIEKLEAAQAPKK